ncbi:MAG: hypothetical protein A2283_02155 [Lentisphaerae bacterium RIFOXYA12_FULL_48_11]|nr:MAG: hypothetical protein A2283_02155 [Lentisphaerae bacterium RIFOXYA12_FULL_48_11]
MEIGVGAWNLLFKFSSSYAEDLYMIGVSNIGSDPLLSFPGQGISHTGRTSEDRGYPEGDVVLLNGEAEESAGIYTEEDILLGAREQPDGSDKSGRQMISELEARDREVRSHEQAHIALLGRYAIGGPSFNYQMGPDGRAYAVGGSVTVDLSTEATPEATAMKARIIGRAAMGGGESSNADRAVALAASRMGIQAVA